MSEYLQSPVCTLCLETFTNPKILPCFHTFCEDCLNSLVSHKKNRKTFSCPSCRRTIKIPPGGVRAFQTNFYIHTAEEKTDETRKPMCTTHPERQLVAFCLSCDLSVCVRCVLGDHKQHDVQEVAETVPKVRQRLTGAKAQLRECIDSVVAHLVEELDLQQALKQRQAEAEWDIERRHDVLVGVVGRLRDQALAEVRQLTGELENEQTDSVASLQKKLEHLHQLEELTKTALGKADIDLLVAAKEIDIKNGLWLNDVEAMKSQETEFWNTTAYRSKETFARVWKHTFRFLGYSIVQTTPSAFFKDVYLQKRFQSFSNPVHCLCPCENGDVWVSYALSHAPIQRFSPQGQLLETRKDITGTVSIKNYAGGKTICAVSRKERIQTYAKSSRLLILDNGLRGKAEVARLDTDTSQWVRLFAIVCGPHLAFDCNEEETVFAVLENETFVTGERSVKIFRRPKSRPVFTLTPRSFLPSDVCFYGRGEREVLLLAEETERSVQVMAWRDGMLCFCGTLVNVSLFSVTPSALATDHRGNVWIGTRQGLVISCDVTPEDFQALPDQRSDGHLENVCLWSPYIPNTAISNANNNSSIPRNISNTSSSQEPVGARAGTATRSAEQVDSDIGLGWRSAQHVDSDNGQGMGCAEQVHSDNGRGWWSAEQVDRDNGQGKSSSSSAGDGIEQSQSSVVVKREREQRGCRRKAEPRPEGTGDQEQWSEGGSDGRDPLGVSPWPAFPPQPASSLYSSTMCPSACLFGDFPPTSSSSSSPSAVSMPVSGMQTSTPAAEERLQSGSTSSPWHTTAALETPVLCSAGQAATDRVQEPPLSLLGEKQVSASAHGALTPAPYPSPSALSGHYPVSLFQQTAEASSAKPPSAFGACATSSSVTKPASSSVVVTLSSPVTIPAVPTPSLFGDSPVPLFETSPSSFNTPSHPASRSLARGSANPALFAESPLSSLEEYAAASASPCAAPQSARRGSSRTPPLAASPAPLSEDLSASPPLPPAAQLPVSKDSWPLVLSADSSVSEPLSVASDGGSCSPLFASCPEFAESSSAVHSEPSLFTDCPPASATRPTSVLRPGGVKSACFSG